MWCFGLYWKEVAISYFLFRGTTVFYAKAKIQTLTLLEFAELIEIMEFKEWIAYEQSEHYKNVQLWY
jgi:hypothetical protein